MSGAMSDTAIRKYEEFVCEKISVFLRQVMDPKTFNGQIKNMSDWFNFLAYDIMGHLAFGKGFNMMESDEHHYVQPLIEQFQHKGSVVSENPSPALMLPLLCGINPFYSSPSAGGRS